MKIPSVLYSARKPVMAYQKFVLADCVTHIPCRFRLVPTSMTLNGVIAFILHFFTEFDSFAGRLCHSGWR